MRQCEKIRLKSGGHRTVGVDPPQTRLRKIPTERQIESGRRSLVRVFVKNRTQTQRWETNMPGNSAHRVPGRMIRQKPIPTHTCPICGVQH